MTKMANIDSLVMTKTAENITLWDRTYLYSPYKGVPLLPREKISSRYISVYFGGAGSKI